MGRTRKRKIGIKERLNAIEEIRRIPEFTSEQKRNKKILLLALEKDLNACEISNLNDPEIICLSNRNYGAPLSAAYISQIIKPYYPKREPKNKHAYNERKNTERKKRTGDIKCVCRCAMCGSSENLELHHMIPVSLDGTSENENLIYLCHECHVRVTAYQKRIEHKKSDCLRNAVRKLLIITERGENNA